MIAKGVSLLGAGKDPHHHNKIDYAVGVSEIKKVGTQVKQGDGTNPTPAIPYAGFEHFGLGVRDLDKVAAELKAKGVEFTREPVTPRPGIRICFIRSPQGISIELLERDAKYV